jgi:hypothetical protein
MASAGGACVAAAYPSVRRDAAGKEHKTASFARFRPGMGAARTQGMGLVLRAHLEQRRRRCRRRHAIGKLSFVPPTRGSPWASGMLCTARRWQNVASIAVKQPSAAGQHRGGLRGVVRARLALALMDCR